MLDGIFGKVFAFLHKNLYVQGRGRERERGRGVPKNLVSAPIFLGSRRISAAADLSQGTL